MRIHGQEQRAIDARRRRCSTTAAQIATMCASLNVVRSEEPRWPDVPNATRSAARSAPGASAKYRVTSSGTFVRESCAAPDSFSCIDPVPSL
jgi:hypothetical protein